MKKQCVIRTYPPNWSKTNQDLQSKLDEGWLVIFITPISEGILEYILEKDYKSQ